MIGPRHADFEFGMRACYGDNRKANRTPAVRTAERELEESNEQ